MTLPVTENEPYEQIVARHLDGYRTNPRPASTDLGLVPDPRFPADVHTRAGEFENRAGQVGIIATVGSLLGGAVAAALTTVGLPSEVSFTLLATSVAAMPAAAMVCGGSHVHRFGFQRRLVQVPKEIADAYENFWNAPLDLRETDADLTVVGAVESRFPYMEELINETITLTARDAMHTPAGSGVRDQILRLAAEATALVEMDKKRYVLAEATTEAEALLQRRPAPMTEVADRIAEESKACAAALTWASETGMAEPT